MLTRTLLTLALLGLASGRRLRRGYHLHERRDDAPHGYQHTGPANATRVVQFRVGIVQNNPKGLIDALYNVSMPDSPAYGQHLSSDELYQFIAPKAESTKAVHDFLSANGLTANTISPAGDWISFNTTVRHANDLFGAEYSNYLHMDSGVQSLHTLEYSIPTALKGHLHVLHPGISFMAPQRAKAEVELLGRRASRSNVTRSARGDDCTQQMTPACFQSLYGLPTTRATQEKNGVIVSAYGGQSANMNDLSAFMSEYRPDMAKTGGVVFKTVSMDGGSNSQADGGAGAEATLDVQAVVGNTNGIPTTFAAMGNDNHDFAGNFLDLINYLQNLQDPPTAFSTSYGFGETGMSRQLADSLCNGYAALGARGISVFFASGDSGVGGSTSDGKCSTKFAPGFPAACPFVTAVGATHSIPEVGEDWSGGGFSTLYDVPDYQKDAVKKYLDAHKDLDTTKFNAGGRAYPDVSAQGGNFALIMNGKPAGVGGTSASSPFFAATIALVNEQLMAKGKKPLGFINPLLYANPEALNDITKGQNPDPNCVNNGGFPADVAWDPLSGLGTPNFAKLLKAAGL